MARFLAEVKRKSWVSRPRRPAPLQRVLIAELDSVAQRELYDRCGAAESEQRIVGALRAAHLLSGTILVTDSMLLDSRFFTAIGPQELAVRLGVTRNRLPIRIVSPSGSLREALATKLADPAFRWQLDDEEIGRARADVRVRAGWQRWLEAEEAGYVGSGRYGASFSLAVKFNVHSDHDHVQTFVTRAQEAQSSRSAVYRTHEEIRAAAPDHLHAELDALLVHWNFSYLQAMADQHGASWITLESRQIAAAKRVADHALQISGELRDLIAQAPPGVYAHMSFAARDAVARFKAEPGERHLRAMAFALELASRTVSLDETRRGAVLSLAMAVAGVALGFAQNEGHAHLGAWTALVFLLASAATFPWSALPVFRRTGSHHTAGLLVIGGADGEA